MHPDRRQALYTLGAAGAGAITGCLRLASDESDPDQSPTGTQATGAETTAGPVAFSVSVVGQQFWWEFSYPAFDLSGRQELVLPVETTVELGVTSGDVVHGFGVEALGVTADAIPDERSETVVMPDSTGEFTAVCTEYCGEGHSEMTATVRIVSESEFEQWRS